MIKLGDMILPAWMIEALEKLRKEQDQKRPELRIEMPLHEPERRIRENESEEQEDTIIISLR